MDTEPCEFCGYEVPLSWNYCPHCARPGRFPNVRATQVDDEREALDQRYQAALNEATRRGCRGVLDSFETAAAGSKAVINRRLEEIERLSSSDQELYSTYYKLLDAQARLPHGNQWDRLRGLADEALFNGYRGEIRFAALSLDGTGLPAYGECTFVLRDDMISHRASVFEENSALFMERHNYKAPPGHRAPWAERSRLSVAKIAGDLAPTTSPTDFPGLLLLPGGKPEEDRFVEVHIWGPISRRGCERVVLATGARPPQKSRLKALKKRLGDVGVPVEVR